MIAVLHREKAAISQACEHVALVQRSLFNCIIMLNNQNNEQAVANYQDAKRRLSELNEMMADLGRKVQEDSNGKAPS